MSPDSEKDFWFAKFVPPTIANGRVFLATGSGKVMVYDRDSVPNKVESTLLNRPGRSQLLSLRRSCVSIASRTLGSGSTPFIALSNV